MTATPGSISEAERTDTPTPGSSAWIPPSALQALQISNPPTDSALPHMSSTANGNDDASDVSMSAETEDSDDDSQNDGEHACSKTFSQPTTRESLIAGQKRKMSSGQVTIDKQSWIAARGEDHKRLKLELSRDSAIMTYRDKDGHLRNDRSLLPAEIWHHIFTFTSPRALGRSLQVSKVFRAYLDPSYFAKPHNFASLSISVAQMRTPEGIWQASRRLFHHGMPSPIQGLTELVMWRLVCTPTCQFCGRKDQRPSSTATDPWRPGPGENGVNTIWPFALRSCGSCLKQRCVKDIDLLLSSVPSQLMDALPLVILTNNLHIMSSSFLQNNPLPPHVQIGKFFLKSHVEDIKVEFFKVKALGSGAAEEWLKGLDERGRERRSDSSRWERWEAIGGVQRMQSTERPQSQVLVAKPKIGTTGSILPKDSMRPPSSTSFRTQGGSGGFAQSNGFHSEQSTNVQFSSSLPPRFDSPAQNGFSSNFSRPFAPPRMERTKEEVAELKAARRAEIERRCMLLDPPLTPAVLSHMGSFQAAIQIITPLDDNSWEMLRPRLLSQREEAQQRENDLVAQNRIVQEKYDERRQNDVHLKEIKDVNDREWDDIQAPLRARIGGFADELIRDGWRGGEKVTKESSPKFAADVLIYVRKRFYAVVAKDEAAARAAGHEPIVDPPNGPFTQKLILENMKWVFDTKIKPLTEQYSKELFLCNGCENNFKFYGFEGVIQHYAAKHTSVLSVGSIVVHWRAEWPEYPPFNPEPGSAVNTFNSAARSSSSYANAPALSQQSHTFGGYPPVSGQVAPPVQAQQHTLGYQQNLVPYYSHSQYGDQYPMPQPGPFVQPPAIHGQSPAFQGPPYQGPATGGYQPYQAQGYPMQVYDGQYQNAPSMTFDSPHPGQVYPVPMEQPGQMYPQAAPFQAAGHYNPSQYNNAQHNLEPRPVAPVRTEAYKAQLHHVAQAAREVWNHTTGVKDMPGSVRVYVILHHILKRFRAKYPDDPPLSMLIDGLSNNKDMRPVRNVNGLACRTCRLEKINSGSNPNKGSSKGSGAPDKKLFSLPQLLNHFQSTHIDGSESPIHDWTQDMVELPDTARITALTHAHGMDDHKMQLITDALPEAFRESPPRLEHEKPVNSYQRYAHEEETDLYGQLAPSRDDHQKYYTTEPRARYTTVEDSQFDRSEINSDQMIRDGPILVASSRRHHLEDRPLEYRESAPINYVERRAASPPVPVRVVDGFRRHVVHDGGRVYAEPVDQYRDTDPGYRGRRTRAPEVIPYDDQLAPRNEHGYVREVSLPRLLEMTAVNRGHQVVHVNNEPKPRSNPSRPVSHSSVPSRNLQPSRIDPVDGGSEDGELRVQPTPNPTSKNMPLSVEAENAAERFLNEFQPSVHVDDYGKNSEETEHRNEEAVRRNWEIDRPESLRRGYQPPLEAHARMQERLDDEGRATVISVPPTSTDKSPESRHGRPRYERSVPPHEAYEYDDRFVKGVDVPLTHAHSPEIGEHRYRVNSALYRDDRQVVHGVQSTTGRFARYESVRVENDRARSRSPIYVKFGGHPAQYRERSPSARYPQQEPIYRARTPQPQIQDLPYERIPRQEYYRVYTDEPRARPPHHETQLEYVQIADSKGDYLIRRPTRRDPELLYTAFEDATFTPRQTIYETRAPVSRSDPAYYEEYDPRHPAPPPTTTVRQVRYE